MFKWSVTTSATALSAMMLMAMSVQAGPAEVRHSSLVNVLEQELALDTPVDASSSESAELKSGCSDDVFKLQTNGDLVMTVSSWLSTDVRDEQSYFVCSTSEKNKYVAASFESADGDYYNSPFRMKLTASKSYSAAAELVKGWYLTVQEDNEADSRYPGFLRVSADPDSTRATWWLLRSVDGVEYLTVAYSPAAPSINYQDKWTLSMPPDSVRNSKSKYVAVGPTATNDLSYAVSFERTPVSNN